MTVEHAAAQPSRQEAIQQNDIFLAAVMRGDPAKVEEMLQRGAVANAFNQYGATPLHWVASEDFPAIARLLLKYGAEPNAKACDGCTALHWACRDESLDTAKVLLEEGGANAQIRNCSGLLPVDMIHDDDEVPDLVALLHAHGGARVAVQVDTAVSITANGGNPYLAGGVSTADEHHYPSILRTIDADANVTTDAAAEELGRHVMRLGLSDPECIVFGFDGDASADLSTGGGGDFTVGVGSTDICVGTDTDGPLGPVQVVYEDSVQVESRLRADGLVETAVG